MSTSSHQRDFLTFSPSLLQILSLLGLDDVITCKRVSHRFYDLIQRNSKSLPQQPILLHIHTNRKENSEDIAYVHVRAYFKLKVFPYYPVMFEASLTDQSIRVHECTVISMRRHYTEQIRMMGSSHPAYYEHPELTYDFNISNRDGLMELPISSRKEELQYILHSVLAHYSVQKIELDFRYRSKPQWNTPDELRDVIVDSIRQRRLSRKLPDRSCESITVRRAWPRLEELYQLLDSRQLSVIAYDMPLEVQLLHMLNWEHKMQIKLYHNGENSRILHFTRAWADGTSRMLPLWLDHSQRFEGDRVDRMVELLRQGLSHSDVLVIPARSPGGGQYFSDEDAHIFIDRPADNAVLYMAYSVVYTLDILMYDDVPVSGTPLRFDYDKFDFDSYN